MDASISSFEMIFLKEVSQIIDAKVRSGIEKLESDLVEVISKEAHVDKDDIKKACKKLQKRIQSKFDRNMDKFEVYCRRNIFINPKRPVNKDSAVSEPSLKKTKASADLDNSRDKYEKVLLEYLRSSREAKEAEVLFQEMKSALFDLQVGSQVLEEFNINPLDETLVGISQQYKSLQTLRDKADDFTEDMLAMLPTSASPTLERERDETDLSPVLTASAGRKVAPSRTVAPSVATIDVNDIGDVQRITRSLR